MKTSAKMNIKIKPSFAIIFISIAAVVGLVLEKMIGLNFWEGFLITVFALLVNGWVSHWEDNQPGGFNNPKRPPDSK
jgi:hypothetical protein